MMQSYASAARLLGGRPILLFGIEAMETQRVTATSDHLGIHLAGKRINARSGLGLAKVSSSKLHSCRWTQDRTCRGLAACDVAPQSNQQFACQGDDHGFTQSRPAVRCPCLIPLRQGTVLLEHEPAPRQLDHASADPRIAGSGQSLLAAPAPTFIGWACQATVTRHSSLVAQVASEDFVNEHVGGLDTNSQDPSQHADHRMRPFVRRLLKSLQSRSLDLCDLLTHQLQPRHIAAQLGQCVWWKWLAFGSAQRLESLARLAQLNFE